ncbi:MAG TPA: hypothetical protein VE710_24090 [Candidatus Bathyarchaeia archaeon]|nr:hypothetical protein [Candidatus Bathyarchaeia archaeon]
MHRVDAAREAVQKAFAWLDRSYQADQSLLLFADDAWLNQLLLFRFGSQFPEISRKWQATVDERVAQIKQMTFEDVVDHGGQTLHERIQFADQLMAVVMLTHLLSRCEPTGPDTNRLLAKTEQLFATYEQQVHKSGFLYQYMYAYNLKKCGLSVPSYFQLTESYAGLPREVAFIFQAYYYTHILFADADMLEIPSMPAEPYSHVFAFIRQHADLVMGQNLHDLVSEFAICMALCNLHDDELYHRLLDHLLAHQSAEGNWQHPTYDLRIKRHCAYLSNIALLEVLTRSVTTR